jgi:hypothetical protein
LVEGKKGVDLEEALREWEGNVGIERKSKVGKKVRGRVAAQPFIPTAPQQIPTTTVIPTTTTDTTHLKSRSLTPDMFKLPLTAMFKRSLSVPALTPAAHPSPLEVEVDDAPLYATRRASSASSTSSGGSFGFEMERFEYPREEAAGVGAECLSPLTMSPVFERDTLAAHWSDVSTPHTHIQPNY